MFDIENGSQWCRITDATNAGLRPSYHNNGSVSPPSLLGNIQTVLTRTTRSGQAHDAAFIFGREQEVGSIEVGKLADVVQLDVDPHDVDSMHIEDGITVQATWLSGERP